MSGVRSVVCGFGVNDASYLTNNRVNGRTVKCPIYSRWLSIINRCYGKSGIANNPTYFGCCVDHRWRKFSGFKKWMEKQDWEGKEIDKDLIVPGNKVYGPDTCCFVSPLINKLIKSGYRKSSGLLTGVRTEYNRFAGQVTINGHRKYLGMFTTEEEANRAYRIEKGKYMLELSNDIVDKRVKESLCKIANNLITGAI